MLHALTRKFLLGNGVDLEAVAEQCAPTFTGADLYALCADAWMCALRREATNQACYRQSDPHLLLPLPTAVFAQQWSSLACNLKAGHGSSPLPLSCW